MPGQCLNFRRLVLLPKLGILVLTLSLPAAQVRTAHAGSPALAKTKLIWPSFGIAFPTGRFAEIDPKTSKAGHKTGFDVKLFWTLAGSGFQLISKEEGFAS